MAASESGTCGYRLDIGLDEEELSAEPCERPTWEDYERCIWHAPEDGKTVEMLEDAAPEPGDDLDGAYLKQASLLGVDWFVGTSLVGADFTEAEVNSSDFSDANLLFATLTDVSAINADFTGANLEGAIFTNADLRRTTLEDALLDEVVFTDIHIGSGTTFDETSIYERESVEPTLSRDHPLEAAVWTYRQFQQIYQENALPQLARQSHNLEKNARRRLAFERGNYVKALKWEASRLVMEYGSSPYRVLGASLLVIVASAILFPLTGGIQETQGEAAITYTIENPREAPPLWLGTVLVKSLYFSVVTFATLGYGDIQPIGTWARLLASVETILGSLLSALLVFVLARIVTW